MSFLAPPKAAQPAYIPPAAPPPTPPPIQPPQGTPQQFANKSGAGTPSFMSMAPPPQSQTGQRSLLGA